MTKIIKDQVIASTHLDLHGEHLSIEVVEKFFAQLPEISVMNNSHDLSRPPIAKGFNKRLKKLPSGELAIILDTEIYDEKEYNRMGGFSISFTRQTIRYGRNKPSVCVLINPHQFDFKDTANLISQILPISHSIDVTERLEKADVLEIAIIGVAIYASLEITRGFLNAAGAELFNVLKKLKRKDIKNGPQKLQIKVNIQIENKNIPVFLIPSEKISNKDLSNIDLEELISIINSLPYSNSLNRIVAEIIPGPQYKLKYVIDTNGEIIITR